MRKGVIDLIRGPVVIGSGVPDIQLGEVVEVGEERLLGEVVEVERERFIVQVYESTSGVKPGEPIYPTGKRLVAELGPGLLSSIFDGLERPLKTLYELSGPFIGRGLRVNALDRHRKWHFRPLVKRGEEVSGGDVIGLVQETSVIEHRVMVPPDLRGRVAEVWEGDFTVEDVVAVIERGERRYELRLMQEWPVRLPRPYREKLPPEVPLITGQRVIDTFFPVAKGGAVCIPGGFGTGKTMTLHKISMRSDADVVIYVGCGERGNEMSELLTEFPRLTDPRTGRPLMERSILIANTSNMPVLAREASVYLGITIAEYYRDQGYNVLMIADSSSRWAEAIREVATRLEEMPVEEGFPAYLPDRLAELYERAGRVVALGRPEREGSATVIAAVSPPGGDFNEPVTVHTLRFVGAMWALDPELAYRRHFPAINWLKSFSQYAAAVEKWWEEKFPGFSKYRRRALRLLTVASEIEAIANIVGEGMLPDDQRLILLASEVLREGYLRQVALEGEDFFCRPEKQYLMLKTMMDFYDKAYMLIRHGVPVDELVALREVYELMRVKEDERGLEAVKEAAARLNEALEKLAEKHGVKLGGSSG